MMDEGMWFGVRGQMRFIPHVSIDPTMSSVGWQAQSNYLNGGAGVRRSTAGHKEYVFSWNLASRDKLRPITDYADGVYDTQDGVNLIYFIDPVAADKNVLPQLWATPSQARADGMTLFPGVEPNVIATPANTLGYPARSAVYSTTTSSSTLWIPVPPGYVAWVGAHGSATGAAGVVATPTLGLASLAPVPLTLLPVTSNMRVNHSFSSVTCDGILLSLANTGLASTDLLTLSGMMVQILPAGATPATGGFISGQGHSGCQFLGKPVMTPRSVGLDKVAMSATLIETGSWL